MSEPVIPGAPAGVRLRPHLDQLTVYTPGASTGVPAGIPIVKLSSNEGAEGPTPAALAALSAEAPDLNRYPDAGELHAALAAAHGLAPDMVAASPGADMSIAYLASAFLGPGDDVVFAGDDRFNLTMGGKPMSFRKVTVKPSDVFSHFVS